MAGTRGWSPNVYTIYELCVAPRCPDSRNRRYQFLLNTEQVGLAPLGSESNDLLFRALGFDGPFSGTRHQFMVLGQHRQTIPTNSEYSVPQIRMLLRQVESILGRKVELSKWDSL